MNELVEDGGGPAGVVDGLVAKLPKPLARSFDPGVDGGLDERGTVQDISAMLQLQVSGPMDLLFQIHDVGNSAESQITSCCPHEM